MPRSASDGRLHASAGILQHDRMLRRASSVDVMYKIMKVKTEFHQVLSRAEKDTTNHNQPHAVIASDKAARRGDCALGASRL